MDQIKIGKFIAACRKEQGLTQAALAEKLGISDRAVSKWETGKALPDIDKISELCTYLHVDVNELLSGEKLTTEVYREKAEENLMETLNNSSFTLKEKIRYFKKKWRREHMGMLILMAFLPAAVFAVGFLLKEVLIGYVVAILLAVLCYGFCRNCMMAYVERNAYDGSGRQ